LFYMMSLGCSIGNSIAADGYEIPSLRRLCDDFR